MTFENFGFELIHRKMSQRLNQGSELATELLRVKTPYDPKISPKFRTNETV